jgi:hypothetical protein
VRTANPSSSSLLASYDTPTGKKRHHSDDVASGGASMDTDANSRRVRLHLFPDKLQQRNFLAEMEQSLTDDDEEIPSFLRSLHSRGNKEDANNKPTPSTVSAVNHQGGSPGVAKTHAFKKAVGTIEDQQQRVSHRTQY